MLKQRKVNRQTVSRQLATSSENHQHSIFGRIGDQWVAISSPDLSQWHLPAYCLYHYDHKCFNYLVETVQGLFSSEEANPKEQNS